MGLAILKLWLWLASFSKPRITDLAAPLQHRFFVWPLDLDENLHMNNSRYLNYMELARWDLNIRSGFLKYALKHKIMAPVLNTAIVYRRSLGPLQTFCVDTQLVHRQGNSLFIEHSISRQQQVWAGIFFAEHATNRVKPDRTRGAVGQTYSEEITLLPSVCHWAICKRITFLSNLPTLVLGTSVTSAICRGMPHLLIRPCSTNGSM